ncbi:MAG: hypothetical protein IKC47_02535 [Clostridia bacterium]|nr:hypothetical protein [Clostridia bacterium]
MSNYNRDDDFFSSEYDKIAAQTQPKQAQPSNADVEGWYSHQSPQPARAPRKRWGIAVVSILMVLAFVGGFVLSSIFKPVTSEDLLNEVIKTIEEKFLWGEEITDEQQMVMVEQAGTAMLQSLDRYSRLLSPQTAYELFNPVPVQMTGGEQGYFGFGYQYATFGLYVSQVYSDSNSYGKLQEGDLIVRFENCYGSSGKLEDINVVDYSQQELVDKMSKISKCTVKLLRNGNLATCNLQRADVGNGNEEFVMVEYYFGEDNTNMSTTPQNGAAISTVQGRKLKLLPSHVGYIRLNEFEHYPLSASQDVTAEQEFKKALDKFKASGKTKLIVDLKGNPGGYVSSACNIIGLLAKDNSQYGKLLGCTLQDRHKNVQSYYAEAGYNMYDHYFGAQDGATKDIVVWTDGNSASASELTTGALLDYGTAIQMGTTSYGKGIAQVADPLPYTGTAIDDKGNQVEYNWYVYYTTAYYFSPRGINIHGVGYTPEDKYNNLASYGELVTAVIDYWG